MLLSKHNEYTEEALAGAEVSGDMGEQILLGAKANDLCEFTNELSPFITSKEKIDRTFGQKQKCLGSIAIWQSHYGNLAAMHAMARARGEPAPVTANELSAWFDFLNGVALGQIRFDPDMEIRDLPSPIQGQFQSHSIEFDQIFDSEEAGQIKLRSIGMMLHLIQDSYTLSHCQRNQAGEIEKFLHYGSQNKDLHKEHDDVSGQKREAMVAECSKCIKDTLIDRQAYECGPIMALAPNCAVSDGGLCSR